MGFKWDHCPGCDSSVINAKLDGDHMHQYIGHGGVVIVWFIDGIGFQSSGEAQQHVINTLECTRQEAAKFMLSIKRLYR